MSESVSRRDGNTIDAQFRVHFVERIYDGADRWYDREWRRTHHDQVSGTNAECLDREPGVKTLMRESHDRHELYNNRIPYYVACVNPTCAFRNWGLVNPYQGGPVTIEEMSRIETEMEHALKALARGRMSDFRDVCETCSGKMPSFPVHTISRKWIYVLKEVGSSLQPYCEIYSETPNTGWIYTRLEEGRFSDARRQPYQGYVNLLPNPTAHTWHFFLSPVRLGRESLDLLCRSGQEQSSYAQKRDAANPAQWHVGVIPDLQPWNTTVRRRFTDRQVNTPYEFVPLVDFFAWAAEIVDFDFMPILAAQQKLARDADEQAKAFIAATLSQAIGRRQTSENPPEFAEDEWDVRDDTLDPPSSFSGSGNIAKAWIDRYQATMEYLTQEVERACNRLMFPVRYALGHRITELACQERGQEPGFLSHGLIHWHHILSHVLACRTGEVFVTWLARNDEAAERIPRKNVLDGEGVGPGTAVRRETEAGLLVQLFANLAPAALAGAERPSESLVEHLRRIDVQASSVGLKEIQGVRNLALDISSAVLDRYVERLPESLEVEAMHRRTIATDWQGRLKLLSTMRDFENGMSLLMNIIEYNKQGRTYESDWDRFGRRRALVETPIKVAEFLGKQAQRALKARLTGEAAAIFERAERQGLRSLTAAELEIVSATRTVSAYRHLGTGLRVLAGPVGLVVGGADLVAESGQTIDSWEAGDPGAAVAHGIQAAAAVLAIAVAGAECAALVTGAAVASWAGPVGWIAAGLMLIGAAVLAWASKNDLEMFAAHCFLGGEYGRGDWDDQTGKAWMGGRPWPALRYDSGTRDARDRWERQRLALLRMLSGFHVWCGPSWGVSTPGIYVPGYVHPTYVPATGHFEIEIEIKPQGRSTPVETYRAFLWPNMSTDHYSWQGTAPGRDSRIQILNNAAGQPGAFRLDIRPQSISGGLVDYQIRVRLDLDGAGNHFLPASGAWVVNGSASIGALSIYHQSNSSEVD